jgi:NTE family protein
MEFLLCVKVEQSIIRDDMGRQNASAVKVGIALSGGSTLGIAHIGVLKALIGYGIPIDCISGTSAGSVVATGFAFGLSIDRMIELSKDLDWKKISRMSYSKLGLRTNKPMEDYIIAELGDVKIEKSPIPLAIVSTDIETFETVTFTRGKVTDAVRASTCIPGYFVPVEIKGRMFVDGGTSENLPLGALEKMGATIKIGVNLAAHPMKSRPKTMFGVLMNSVISLAHHRNVALSSQADILIEPNLAKFDFMKFKDAELMMDEGYRSARKMIPIIKEMIELQQQKSSLMGKVKSFFKLNKLGIRYP